MAAKYTNIKRVIEGIMIHPMLRELTMEQAIFYTQRFMQLVGCPFQFEEKTEVLPVQDFMAPLPCDFHEIIGVRNTEDNRAIQSSTSSFGMSLRRERNVPETYKIQGRMIVMTFPEGEIEVSYIAYKTDCDGYPMVPDDEFFISALEAYIKREFFKILYDQGKLQLNQIEAAKQDYAQAVFRLGGHNNMPTYDDMENVSNMLTSLLPHEFEYEQGYNTIGVKEHYKTH